MFRLDAARCLLLMGLLALSGCRISEPRVQVSGQVLSDGKPLSLKSSQKLFVLFCPLDEQNKPTEKSYRAEVDHQGNFTAAVVPGKHRIVVRLLQENKDTLHDAFGALKSPFVREVHEGDSFTLDLRKPSG